LDSQNKYDPKTLEEFHAATLVIDRCAVCNAFGMRDYIQFDLAGPGQNRLTDCIREATASGNISERGQTRRGN